MKYNVRIACEHQARVINFTVECNDTSINTLTKCFNSVVKENYAVQVEKGCKSHRGKAVSFIEALTKASQVRFYKIVSVPNYTITEEHEELFILNLPYCNIVSNVADWGGTFFSIEASSLVDIKPDIDKISNAFKTHGLDWCVAVNGKYYTHYKIKFERISSLESCQWKVYKVALHKEFYWTQEKREL